MRRGWTEKEQLVCRKLISAGLTRDYIATFMGRSKKAISNKFGNRSVKVSAISKDERKLLRERDRRLALPPRDLTAAFFGDPLPGFSALERRA